jgi:hypothetical protein
MQVQGTISPTTALTISAFGMAVAPGSLNASAAGTISGAKVTVELSSVVQDVNESSRQRVGSIKVFSSAGASLDALLVSQASQASTDAGVSVPTPPRGGYPNDGTPSSAELVFDPLHGLRMLNFSLASLGKFSLADMARRVGFSWQSSADSGAAADPVSFSAPWLYFVPSKPGAPSISWGGKSITLAELGVAATVDVPALGINSTRATLLVQKGGLLTLEVS